MSAQFFGFEPKLIYKVCSVSRAPWAFINSLGHRNKKDGSFLVDRRTSDFNKSWKVCSKKDVEVVKRNLHHLGWRFFPISKYSGTFLHFLAGQGPCWGPLPWDLYWMVSQDADPSGVGIFVQSLADRACDNTRPTGHWTWDNHSQKMIRRSFGVLFQNKTLGVELWI